MCGRFALYTAPETLADDFDVDINIPIKMNYNVYPSLPIPVIRNKNQAREIALLTWGLVPNWSKSFQYPQINARCETLHEKPFFRSSFKKRRCIVVANGWYEWQRTASSKQPFYIKHKNNDLLSFAGIWSHWGTGEEYIETVAIITRPASASLRHVHARMPFLLSNAARERWLSEQRFSSIPLDAACNFPDNDLDAFPVCDQVNDTSQNDVSCIHALKKN